MVETRYANGTYTPSEEQKCKIAVSVRKTYATREVFTVEHRKKFSDTMKRTWAEHKIDTTNHWTKTDEGKQRLSQLSKGRVYTSAVRHNMSLGAQKRLRSNRETMYTSAKGGTREDLGVYFRSNWEANFARIMNYLGKAWIYEPETFKIPRGSYTPDFLVDDVYYEIKGRMNEIGQEKIDQFKSTYTDKKLIVIEGVAYNALRLQYKSKIPTWEGK